MKSKLRASILSIIPLLLASDPAKASLFDDDSGWKQVGGDRFFHRFENDEVICFKSPRHGEGGVGDSLQCKFKKSAGTGVVTGDWVRAAENGGRFFLRFENSEIICYKLEGSDLQCAFKEAAKSAKK